MCCVQCTEILYLIGWHWEVGRVGPAGEVAASRQGGREEQQASAHIAEVAHDPPTPSLLTISSSGPGPAGGTWMVSERSTTTAATTPNTNWETINHGQLMWSWSVLSTTPIRP